MAGQIPVDPAARADERSDHGVYELAPDLACQWVIIANVQYYGAPGDAFITTRVARLPGIGAPWELASPDTI